MICRCVQIITEKGGKNERDREGLASRFKSRIRTGRRKPTSFFVGKKFAITENIFQKCIAMHIII